MFFSACQYFKGDDSTIANERIRKEAKAKGVRLWQIAECLGISEPTMTRKLRHELAADEEAKVLRIITNLTDRTVEKK